MPPLVETSRNRASGAGSPPQKAPLFRPEVLADRSSQWLGTILLQPRVVDHTSVVAAVTMVFAIVALLLFGSYTRKERIGGWLVPEQGLASVFTPLQGVVTQLKMQNGTNVKKGAPLVVVSTELHSGAAGATREEIVRRVTSRRDSIAAERRSQEMLFDQQAESLRRRIETLRTEQGLLVKEIGIQRERHAMTARAMDKEKQLLSRQLTTAPRLRLIAQDYFSQAAALQALERNQATLQRQFIEVQATSAELPLQRRAKLAEIERNVSAVEQELAEAEARREIVLTAPHDGMVTNLQIENGGFARPDIPLLSIVPAGSVLQAQLFCPSRAIGFIRPGQRVLLRYRAFPYQKFGFYEGKVADISQTASSAAEMPRQLAGLTSLFAATEPIYRLTIDLGSQNAVAYGRPVPLQPGMQLDADIQIESRRLIEWILAPLFTLTK